MAEQWVPKGSRSWVLAYTLISATSRQSNWIFVPEFFGCPESDLQCLHVLLWIRDSLS